LVESIIAQGPTKTKAFVPEFNVFALSAQPNTGCAQPFYRQQEPTSMRSRALQRG
jgi:hypothetical protein